MKRNHWKVFIVSVVLAEAVGALSGWLTRDGAQQYAQSIVLPPLSPPGIVFPIVWTVLFALMGIGSAIVWLAPDSQARSGALRLYAVQLAFNFVWSLIFFNWKNYGFAFVWLAALWVLIGWMILRFRALVPAAGWTQVSYFLWVAFAGYLNLGVWLLN